MNKVELAVCRIRQILPQNEGSLTRGSGCVVKCERLAAALEWKCPFVLVTSSKVLHRDELTAGKAFVADFLLKDKKGLESFELNLASDTCVHILGRDAADVTESTAETTSTKEQSMITIISVEKLDKRGFLKRMTKKSSLQTTRPLDCFDTAKLSEELNDVLFCHITREEGQNFSTRTYKFLFETELHRFVLHDFGSTEINSVRGFSSEDAPLGAVIYTKRGEFAGMLEFSNEAIAPCFFPAGFRVSSGR